MATFGIFLITLHICLKFAYKLKEKKLSHEHELRISELSSEIRRVNVKHKLALARIKKLEKYK